MQKGQWVSLLVGAVCLAGLVACGSPTVVQVPAGGGTGVNFIAATPPPAETVPVGKGEIFGGIEPCEGIFIPGKDEFVAGRVLVLAGTVKWAPVSPGVSKAVLPTKVVASEQVTSNGEYQFLLPPGEYVILGQYAKGPGSAFAEVMVKAGAVQKTVVPNDCK